MADRTDRERIIELEGEMRSLEARFNGITALVGMLVSARDADAIRRGKIADRMEKARAGRGKKKGS